MTTPTDRPDHRGDAMRVNAPASGNRAVAWIYVGPLVPGGRAPADVRVVAATVDGRVRVRLTGGRVPWPYLRGDELTVPTDQVLTVDDLVTAAHERRPSRVHRDRS